MKTGYFIGFATKFYTLWSIATDYNYSQNEYGQVSLTGITTRYTYLGHLSFELDKAKAKVIEKGIELSGVDMSLKGQSSWEYKDKIYCKIPTSDLGFFDFGKYDGQIISQCTDINYVEWYYFETSNKYAKQVLLSNGYAELNGHIVKQEIADRMNATDSLIAEITASGEFTFVAEKNLSGAGEITIEGITIRFANYIRATYNGFTYGMPSINGKGKRIKNKKLKCIVSANTELWSDAKFIVESFTLVQE